MNLVRCTGNKHNTFEHRGYYTVVLNKEKKIIACFVPVSPKMILKGLRDNFDKELENLHSDNDWLPFCNE